MSRRLLQLQGGKLKAGSNVDGDDDSDMVWALMSNRTDAIQSDDDFPLSQTDNPRMRLPHGASNIIRLLDL